MFGIPNGLVSRLLAIFACLDAHLYQTPASTFVRLVGRGVFMCEGYLGLRPADTQKTSLRVFPMAVDCLVV